MEEMKEFGAGGVAVWPEGTKIEPCSWNMCRNGHKWPPTMGLARCEECGGPILVAKMEQCPICNEPTEEMVLRHDHLPSGGRIVAFCRNEPSLGDVSRLGIKRVHARNVEEAPPGVMVMSVLKREAADAGDGGSNSGQSVGDVQGLLGRGEYPGEREADEIDGKA